MTSHLATELCCMIISSFVAKTSWNIWPLWRSQQNPKTFSKSFDYDVNFLQNNHFLRKYNFVDLSHCFGGYNIYTQTGLKNCFIAHLKNKHKEHHPDHPDWQNSILGQIYCAYQHSEPEVCSSTSWSKLPNMITVWVCLGSWQGH